MKILWENKDGIVIGVDETQWIVADKRVSTEGKNIGKVSFANKHFHAGPHTALIAAAKRVAKDEATTLKEYVEIVQRVGEELKVAIEGGE